MIEKINSMYDIYPLQIIEEEYINYGKEDDINEMSEKELRETVKKLDKRIKELTDDIEHSKDKVPTYSIKEQLKTSIHYKEKLLKRIEDFNHEREMNRLKMQSEFNNFGNSIHDYK